MMASGELQAGFTGPAGIGRAGPPTGNWDKAARPLDPRIYPELIPDAAKVEADWYRRTRHLPDPRHHRGQGRVLARHPVAGALLLDAFTAAKQPYLKRLKSGQGDKPQKLRTSAIANSCR